MMVTISAPSRSVVGGDSAYIVVPATFTVQAGRQSDEGSRAHGVRAEEGAERVGVHSRLDVERHQAVSATP